MSTPDPFLMSDTEIPPAPNFDDEDEIPVAPNFDDEDDVGFSTPARNTQGRNVHMSVIKQKMMGRDERRRRFLAQGRKEAEETLSSSHGPLEKFLKDALEKISKDSRVMDVTIRKLDANIESLEKSKQSLKESIEKMVADRNAASDEQESVLSDLKDHIQYERVQACAQARIQGFDQRIEQLEERLLKVETDYSLTIDSTTIKKEGIENKKFLLQGHREIFGARLKLVSVSLPNSTSDAPAKQPSVNFFELEFTGQISVFTKADTYTKRELVLLKLYFFGDPFNTSDKELEGPLYFSLLQPSFKIEGVPKPVSRALLRDLFGYDVVKRYQETLASATRPIQQPVAIRVAGDEESKAAIEVQQSIGVQQAANSGDSVMVHDNDALQAANERADKKIKLLKRTKF